MEHTQNQEIFPLNSINLVIEKFIKQFKTKFGRSRIALKILYKFDWNLLSNTGEATVYE